MECLYPYSVSFYCNEKKYDKKTSPKDYKVNLYGKRPDAYIKIHLEMPEI